MKPIKIWVIVDQESEKFHTAARTYDMAVDNALELGLDPKTCMAIQIQI